MTDAIFLNESSVDINSVLSNKLASVSKEIAVGLKAAGHSAESLHDSLVLLSLPPKAEPVYDLVKKAQLRQMLATIEEGLSKNKVRPAEIKESLIARCESPTPAGSVRMLFLTEELCGSMQLYLDLDADRTQALKDRLRAATDEAMHYMDAKESRIAEGIYEKIKHLPPEQAMQVVMDAELVASEQLQELRAVRAELGEAQEDMVQNLLEQLPLFREKWKSVLARSKKVVIPPDSNSATNVEALMMAASYTFESIMDYEKLTKEEVAFLIGHFAANEPVVLKLLARMATRLRGNAFSGMLQDFGVMWMRQGFPKLEVGQKLAASLALTEVPEDIEVVVPWKAWSLIVPPGLFGEPSEKEGDVARLWCMGAEIKFIVLTKGGLVGEVKKYRLKKIFDESGTGKLWEAMNSLVKGACLALSNPDEYKRETLKDRHSKAPRKQRDGEPDFAVSRFMLSAPVQIDLRQTLLDELAGKRRALGGGSPTVQFFVRGHWRNQAHGPRMSLRKQMRIEGYWKGPEHGNVLLRNYKVKDVDNGKEGNDTAELHDTRSAGHDGSGGDTVD